MKFTKVIKANKKDFIEQLQDYVDDKIYDCDTLLIKLQQDLNKKIDNAKQVFNYRIEIEEALDIEFGKLAELLNNRVAKIKDILEKLK